MNKKQLWQRYCKLLKIFPDLGISVDISRMRFADDFLEVIAPLVETALMEMEMLEAGSIANPDENRMVGHYWLRSPKRAPRPEITKAIEAVLQKINQFSEAIHQGKIVSEQGLLFKNILLIGIGGSALGPQLIADALGENPSAMKIFFLDNTDPDGMSRVIAEIGSGLVETLTIVISKSGGTIETRNGMLEAKQAYEDHGLSFGRHAVAITCQDSDLDRIASNQQWLERFFIWDWVGGRTSLFSAVGLLPAALLGIDIAGFIAGAEQMDQLSRNDVYKENPAALIAAMWFAAGDGKGLKDMVVLPYKDRLSLFGKYLQQLVMESLGKEKDFDGNRVNQGLAVYGNKGSTDQHAYVQQLREGLNNFFVTFVEVLSDYSPAAKGCSQLEVEPGVTAGDYLNGFFQGTRQALHENGRDSITISLDRIDAQSLGALIALYERTVGIYASLININAYHQPGVEAGKKAAAAVIALQKSVLEKLQTERERKDGFSAEELSLAIGAESEVESVYKILEHLAANPSRGIARLGERHPRQARYRAV